jgi:ubiquinone/menaquinone biosynthesis C-methylase UbiE
MLSRITVGDTLSEEGWGQVDAIPSRTWQGNSPFSESRKDTDMSDILESVRGGYDRWAAVYDHDANPLPALEEPAVRKAVGDVQGMSVLDLGCGTGRHSLWLSAAGADVTAVDFSDGMLEQARRKPGAEAICFLVHDLHLSLPFNMEFDLIVSGLVLEHLRDLDHFFAEAHRVLKPRGRVVVSAMHLAMFLKEVRHDLPIQRRFR